MSSAHITSIYRYPVKGLSGDALGEVRAEAGQGLPFDRAYAIERTPGSFDPANPQFLPKTKFLMLMHHERLAALDTEFDETSLTLDIRRDGRSVARGALDTVSGRNILEQFLSAFMSGDVVAPPHIVAARGHNFSDTGQNWISIINLASVRDLERIIARPVDPLRFRGNVYIDGVEPWAEFSWLDRTVSLGAEVRAAVRQRITRCAATDVDPRTGRRDLSIPRSLMRSFAHMDMGIYAALTAGGKMSRGDTVQIGAPDAP